ncbi:MAG: anti-sigma factor [Actinomycetota bacterium]
MSDQGHTRWRDDLAAHLLGSLPDEEGAELEAHLETCEPCRNELRWLRPAIEVLSDSAARIEPPAELRTRLMAEVREDASKAAEPASARRPLGERFRGFMLRPATALAATAVIGAGVGGYVVAGSDGDRETTVFMEQEGEVSATLSSEGEAGTLELTGVKRPSGSQVYQAWVQQGTRVSRSSQLDMRADGSASARIPNLDSADNVMVTLEDRPGRTQPTTNPLVTLELES